MPLYHHFYVERLGADGWAVPPGFEPAPWMFACDRPFGPFAWAHPRRGWLGLFWGADALFPMRSGPPDDQGNSALLRHLDRFYDYERNEDQLCWLPYPELFTDNWDTDLVTVGAKVPARYALLFGDGRQRFPRVALLGAGAPESELDHLREGWLAREPVDIAFGRERFRLAELSPDCAVAVTWCETIGEFIGEPHAGSFKDLRRYARDEDLRVLSRRG